MAPFASCAPAPPVLRTEMLWHRIHVRFAHSIRCQLLARQHPLGSDRSGILTEHKAIHAIPYWDLLIELSNVTKVA